MEVSKTKIAYFNLEFVIGNSPLSLVLRNETKEKKNNNVTLIPFQKIQRKKTKRIPLDLLKSITFIKRLIHRVRCQKLIKKNKLKNIHSIYLSWLLPTEFVYI